MASGRKSVLLSCNILLRDVRRSGLLCLLCLLLSPTCSQTSAGEGPRSPSERTDPGSLEEARVIGRRRSRYLQQSPEGNSAARPSPSEGTSAVQRTHRFRDDILPILMNRCVGCHGPDAQEGNLRIDTLNPDFSEGSDTDWWLEVQAVVTNGEMPPADADALTDSERAVLAEWLAVEIQAASVQRRGTQEQTPFRRLTRSEFTYALQDLLALPYDFGRDLPPEAASPDGFLNSAEQLHMTTGQLETYRNLALTALRRATVSGERPEVLRWSISMENAAQREWKAQDAEKAKLQQELAGDPDRLATELRALEERFHAEHSNTHYRNRQTGRTAEARWVYHGAQYAFGPSENPAPLPDRPAETSAVLPGGRMQGLIVELGNQLPDEGTLRVRAAVSRVASESDAPPPSLQLQFGWQASNEGRARMRVSSADRIVTAADSEVQIFEWHIPLGEIYPRNSVRRTSPMGVTPSPSEYIRFVNSSVPQSALEIHHVEAAAPVYEAWPPASHRQIFFRTPASPDEEPECAREIIAAVMNRAWRRTVLPEETERKLRLFQLIRSDCDSFEEAVIEVLAAVLSSPEFLYVRADGGSERRDGDSTQADRALQPLSQDALAARLALFLWGSLPDERLLQAAAEGRLADPTVRSAEAERMLQDARSDRLARHFVRQWLDLQLLEFLKAGRRGSRLNAELKESLLEEPTELFASMVQNDDSVLDFLHADYVVVNERLARHYRLPGVSGNQFRRVRVPASVPRGGLLTLGAALAMNSDGEDSHPLKRGIWMLESLLNDPPPPPPPAVPEIDLADPRIAEMTLKERIEDHRNHAACMSCHSKIDPWGLAFENFDGLGRWRDRIGGEPVDSLGVLYNGESLDGMDGLKRFLLMHRQDQFVRALTFKLTTYALGRPLGFADHAGIDQITEAVRREGDGLRTLIRTIVADPMFASP